MNNEKTYIKTGIPASQISGKRVRLRTENEPEGILIELEAFESANGLSIAALPIDEEKVVAIGTGFLKSQLHGNLTQEEFESIQDQL